MEVFNDINKGTLLFLSLPVPKTHIVDISANSIQD